MSSSPVCASCRHALRQQLRQFHQRRTLFRTFPGAQRSVSTTRPFLAGQPSAEPESRTESAPSLSIPATPPNPKQFTEDVSLPTPSISKDINSLAQALRKRAPATTETYVAYGACEKLVKECARQADYKIPQANEKGVEIPKTKDGEDLGVGGGWWYDTLGLQPTFNTWAQVTFLHMYLLTCRFRCFPPTHAPSWHQHLLDHFFYNAEDRMVEYHKMAARGSRHKYLKDLFVQWRGLTAGYDEGLMKGDAVLATAVWRNIFKADENVDFRGVGEVVSYIRGVLKGLDEMKDHGITSGEVVFGNPRNERNGVLVKSLLMDAPYLPQEKQKASQ